MPLTPVEIDTLWTQREPVVSIRSPRWILRYMWAVPAAYIVPLLASRFAQEIVVGVLIGSAVYLGFAMLTYARWRSYSANTSVDWLHSTITLIMAFDGVTLILFSLAFLITAVIWFPSYIAGIGYVSYAVVALYVFQIIFVFARGTSIVRHLIQAHRQALAGDTRWAIGIPVSISSFGVALAAVLRLTSLGALAGGLIAIVGAFLLLPFGATALYQVAVLASNLKTP